MMFLNVALLDLLICTGFFLAHAPQRVVDIMFIWCLTFIILHIGEKERRKK